MTGFLRERKTTFYNKNLEQDMIIINVKDNESIDRALKRYKRKHRNVGIVKELRRRQQYTKPSVKRRNELLKAIYKQEKQEEEEQS